MSFFKNLFGKKKVPDEAHKVQNAPQQRQKKEPPQKISKENRVFDLMLPTFLYWFRDGKMFSTNMNDYPVYLKNVVDNPPHFFKWLIAKGFLVHATPEESLKKLTVGELKSILENEDLASTGKKSKLIETIITNIPPQRIENLLPPVYVPSEKSQSFKKNSDYYNYLTVKKYNLEFEEYMMVRQKITKYVPRPRDIAWAVMNKQSTQYFVDQKYGLFRNVRLSQFYFLKDENKLANAYQMLLAVLYIDLTGFCNGGSRSQIDENLLAPKIVEWINKYQEYYRGKDSIEKVKALSGDLPSYFTDKQFEEILNLIFKNPNLVYEDVLDHFGIPYERP